MAPLGASREFVLWLLIQNGKCFMFSSKLDTKTNRLSLIIILGVMVFCVTGYALSVLKESAMPTNLASEKDFVASDVLPVNPSSSETVQKEKNGLFSVSGIIRTVSEQKDVDGKLIEVSAFSEGATPSGKTYRFFISDEKTAGADASRVMPGNKVTVFSKNEVSETDFVFAEMIVGYVSPESSEK